MGLHTRVTSVQKTRAEEVYDPLNKWCGSGADLLRTRKAKLVLHASIAIAMAILFLSQIAILRSHRRI